MKLKTCKINRTVALSMGDKGTTSANFGHVAHSVACHLFFFKFFQRLTIITP